MSEASPTGADANWRSLLAHFQFCVERGWNLRDVDTATLVEDDAKKLAEFLKEKNEEQLISGFLTRGSLTKENGPLGTKFSISEKSDSKNHSH